MSSTYGEILKLSIFGQSHGPAVGMTLDGVPAGLRIDEDKLTAFLARRAPGRSPLATSRQEGDKPEFLSGIVGGFTCGAPLAAVIRNENTRSADYEALKDCPRPGHADYTAQMKYRGFQDVAGGGHFSGRLTAPLCIAGGLCKQWLEEKGIFIGAHIASIAGIADNTFDPLAPQLEQVQADFPVLDPLAGEKMQQAILDAKAQGDSVGGIIQCAVIGLPAGLGEPMFGGMESRIAQIVYGIPAVKGLEFGEGFGCAILRGSQHNDPFRMDGSRIWAASNHAGGILGGITSGLPLLFQAAIKPTPSISQPQQTVSLRDQEEVTLQIKGRHDPCIVPRAVPVIEAAAAIAVFDAYLAVYGTTER